MRAAGTSTPSRASSSIASDLSRIVLLGIAFDLSRFVTRAIVDILSAKVYGHDDGDVDDKKIQVCRGVVEKQALPLDQLSTIGGKEKDKVSSIEGNTVLIPRTCMDFNRLRFHISRLRKHFSKSIRDRRYLGLYLYLALPPPLLIFGAWELLVCRNNKAPHRLHNFGGLYVSSILSSFGLLGWIYRDWLQRRRSEEDFIDEERVQSSKIIPQKLITNLNELLHPPLQKSSSSIDLDRRPRSDSLRSMMSEFSVGTQTINNSIVVEKDQKKYLEILVHNVSHTDLVLGLSDYEGLMSQVIDKPASVSFPAEHEATPRKNNTPTVSRANECDEKYIMSRPRFSAFDMFSRRVLSELQGQIESTSSDELSGTNRHPLHQKIISYPRYERSSSSARYTLVTPRPSDRYMLPVGFDLERNEGVSNISVDPSEMPNLRLRGRDVAKIRKCNLSPVNEQFDTQSSGLSMQEALRIDAVFFPLLATLLPRWLGRIADKFGGEDVGPKSVAAPLHSPNVKKVVVLVSGVGVPRNWTHSISGNSTQTCAELMELFIRVLYPDITVVRIHSETNIFRYDENITFATQELMPCIDAYRDAHARSEPYPDEAVSSNLERKSYNPDWRQSVSVTYSFADGSAARSHAIQAALRPYRPTYFHFWQLKTFWHESKITDEDIEVHSFEEMETVPAMAVDQTPDTVMMAVNEMKAYRKDFLETLEEGGRSDLKAFWLRKTRKPVLAVLLVQKPGGKYVLYRGTNMEVSMPTGSLCAERNVIGTALANDPGLKREDLLLVVVLSLQLPEDIAKSSLPAGPPLIRSVSSSREGANFARDVEDKLKQVQTHELMCRATSTSSFASISEERQTVEPSKTTDDWEMDVFHDVRQPSPLPSSTQAVASCDKSDVPSIPERESSGHSTPKRRISLYHKQSHRKMGGGMKRQKQSLLVHSIEDMNPLKPCGACNEWLKKIAQSNPHFKVVTFTDTKCNGVYVSPCED